MSVHVERSGNDRQSLRRSAFAVDLTGRQLNKEDGMSGRTSGNYEIANRELVADGSNLRVQVLTLAAGQCVPWHYHSEITDTFVCLEGPMVVETRAPWHDYVLTAGQRCAVSPRTAHYVHGEAHGPCTFLIIQGVGVYDFVPVGG
jgi:quercetin dioxygenase-like cupin family protein